MMPSLYGSAPSAMRIYAPMSRSSLPRELTWINLERRNTMSTIFEWLDSQNIRYNNKQMILEALTHSSYANEHRRVKRDNERLEFMGDAVLQLWSSKKLFSIRPLLNEGRMTTLRSQLVCEEALADYNRKLGLGQYLLLGAGEERNGGRNRDSLLADMFEALLGALFLDQGMYAIDIILEQVLTPAISSPKTRALPRPPPAVHRPAPYHTDHV